MMLTSIALALLASSSAHADWQGTFKLTVISEDKPVLAKIYGKGTKTRWDMTIHGMQSSMIIDYRTQKGAMMMHGQKIKMTLSPEDAANRSGVPHCPTSDLDACLKQKGYKVTGAEKVLGHPCNIWEGDSNGSRGKTHIRIWRPTDLKEVFMLKNETDTNGKKTTAEATELKIGPVADSMFVVPADYREMRGMGMSGPGGRPGMPPGMKLPPGVKLPPGFKMPSH